MFCLQIYSFDEKRTIKKLRFSRLYILEITNRFICSYLGKRKYTNDRKGWVYIAGTR